MQTDSHGGKLHAVAEDPASRTTYDNLGRTIKTIQAYMDGVPSSGDDRTTEFTYDGNSNMLTVKAWSSSTAYQITQYVYGVTRAGGSAIDSNDQLAEAHYPDPSTGNASSTDKEVLHAKRSV